MNGKGNKQFSDNTQRQVQALAKLVQPYLKIIQQINAQMEPHKRIVEQVRENMRAIATIVKPFGNSLFEMLATLEPIRNKFRRFIEQQEALKEYYRKAQMYLFDEGWYLGGDMPIPIYGILAKMVDEGRHTDIEEAMCEWARKELDDIIDSAMKAFKDRAKILKDATDAHRNGKYSLSIPVFFAQSDGMAKEIIGNCLFRGDPTRALETMLDQFDEFPLSGYSDILLDPLRSISLFYKVPPKKVLKCGRTSVNRSEVLHGSQLDYASEANSLRVIVLLGYLVGVKSLLDTHTDEVAEIREELKKAMASD